MHATCRPFQRPVRLKGCRQRVVTTRAQSVANVAKARGKTVSVSHVAAPNVIPSVADNTGVPAEN